MKAQKTFRGTWLDRAGEQTEYLKTSSKLGPRVIVHRWTDTNGVDVRAVTGDAWQGKKPFAEFLQIDLKNPTPAELEAAIAQCEKALETLSENKLIKDTHGYAGGVKVRIVSGVREVPGVYVVEALTAHPSGRKFPQIGEQFRIGSQDFQDGVAT